MFNRFWIVAGIAAGLSLLGTLPSVKAQTDQVFPAKGTPARGTVTAITRDKVSLEGSGGARQIDVKRFHPERVAERP